MTQTQKAETDNPRMCVVGFGRMGKRCAALFSKGFRVEVVSRRDIRAQAEKRGARQSEDAERSLAEADYLFLAVPIDALDAWVPKINEITKPECVVMDCCTVREAANEKLSRLRRRRFGLPEIGGRDLPVDGDADERIREYLRGQGAHLYRLPADSPDRKPVAGVAHFIGMALDLNLTDEERSRMEKSGAGQCLLRLIEHLKTNSPSTYRETQLLEPGMSDRRKEVIAWLSALDQELDRGVFKFSPHPPDRWRE
jgi:prephenate dehydrogenase